MGFRPQIPESAAGCRIEPPVSVPVAPGASRAATAAAEPPELPPGTYAGFHGFLTGPKAEVSFDEPIANSSMFVLPTSTVPARFKPLDDVRVVGRDEVRRASASRRWSASPAVQKMSLCAIGMPVERPARCPARARASAARACGERARRRRP